MSDSDETTVETSSSDETTVETGEAQAVNRFLSDLIARKDEELSKEPNNRIQVVLSGEAAVRSSMGDAVTHDALILNLG